MNLFVVFDDSYYYYEALYACWSLLLSPLDAYFVD
jgi:hypothetical protein